MHDGEWQRGRTWAYIGLGVMFVLIGAGIFFSVLNGNTVTSMPIYYPGQFWMPFFWVWPLVGVFFVVWVIGWAFSWPWRSRGSRYGRRWGDPAHQILRERYARGEITKDQFDQMMRDLESP